MGEEAEKPVDSQTHVCFLFPGSREPLKDRWVLEGEVWGQREDGLEGRLRRNESDVNSTDVCPGPPGSQALRRGLRVEGERETGAVSARSSELGSWPGPPTSEAAALLPPAPLPHPHLVIAGTNPCGPGLMLGSVEGVVAPLRERSPGCHRLGPLERRGWQLLRTKAATTPLGPAQRSRRPLWSALGCGT